MNDIPTPTTPKVAGSKAPAPVAPVIDQARLAEVITGLDAVTKAVIQRYGIHPEADATEAAAVFLRELQITE